jgi:Fe-S cluster assembly iron-binding protein IscA
MLTLTPTAAAAVRKLVADTEVDDETGGLRISPSEADAQGGSLALALVNAPEATDDNIEANGAHVFLEPSVAEILDDRVRDATVEGGRVRFVLFERRAPE